MSGNMYNMGEQLRPYCVSVWSASPLDAAACMACPYVMEGDKVLTDIQDPNHQPLENMYSQTYYDAVYNPQPTYEVTMYGSSSILGKDLSITQVGEFYFPT